MAIAMREEVRRVGPDMSGELGSILGIWAHPDDEAWLSAALMMRAVESGHRVVCVTATRGEAGFPADDNRTLEERAAIREAELANCLALMGVSEHRYLGYGDGQCGNVPDDEAVATLVEIIEDVRPETVLTFGPDGATGHTDHIAACRWTTEAVDRADVDDIRLLYATKTRAWIDLFWGGVDPSTIMMVDDLELEVTPPGDLAVHYVCDEVLVARKVAAMLAQASQLEELARSMGLDVFTEVVREEFFRARRPSDAEAIVRAKTLRHR
jgi:LmbE family N-acetylglucosaminyl deacetylase